MSLYTIQDLQAMQNWPLERKVRVSQLRIMEWYHRWNGKVAVSFSGGADSTVLLDLARRTIPDIPALFINTTMEYPEIIRFVKGFENVDMIKPKITYTKVVKKYGYPVVSKEIAGYIYRMKTYDGCMEAYKNGIHLKSAEWLRDNFSAVPFSFMKCMFGLSKRTEERFLETGIIPPSMFAIPKQWRYLINAPFMINDRCCYHLKKAPQARYCKETGNKPIIGTLAEESLYRRQVWLNRGCNAFEAKMPTSTPLSFWRKQDILEYLKITKIPYCSLYGDIVEDANRRLRFTGYQRTGCAGCLFGCHLEKEPNRLQIMKETHPGIYHYLFDKLGYKEVCDYVGIPY